MDKKTVVINSDYLMLKTGLARNAKELALYLHKTGKYNIIYYACGVQWENNDFQRFPFKVVGALPNNPAELQQIHQDPNYERACSYGLYNIERVIKEFRPDVLILSNDSWAFTLYLDKPFWDKIHCLNHITIDSLPLLPDQVKMMKNSKNFFVWTEFAEKEAKRLGFNHVKTLTGTLNGNQFKKLLKHEKLELRKKNGLPEGAFICGKVARNQLRKEFFSLLVGYSQFKKQNPDVKNTFLLFHTHWSEPAGWDIPRLIQDAGVNPNDVLTTYICRNCREYEVKPFTGQDLNCKCCGQEKGQVTANIADGVTEEQLNEIYNLMDCYAQIYNAGGLEYPAVEALYAELPLATVPYSSGETFTEQPFVYSVDCTYTLQHGSQFKRAVPSPNSIAKFLKKIYEMSPEDRTKLGKQGREWAISKFSSDIICKKWEEIIDSLPPVTWDYSFEAKPKNPNFPIPNTQDNVEWLKSLYINILHMESENSSSSPGIASWLAQLQRGVKREDIYNFFVKTAQDENAKTQIKPLTLDDVLNKNNKKRLLLVAKESAGDLINIIGLLPSFRAQYNKEEWDIYFATEPQYFELFEGNDNIDKLLPYNPVFENEIVCTGSSNSKGWFDSYVYIPVLSQKFLSYLTHNKIALNLNNQ